MEAVIFMKKKLLRLSPISREAYILLSAVLLLCCAMLAASALLLVHIRTLTPETYDLYRLAAELQNSSAAVFLVGNLAALLLEELGGKR